MIGLLRAAAAVFSGQHRQPLQNSTNQTEEAVSYENYQNTTVGIQGIVKGPVTQTFKIERSKKAGPPYYQITRPLSSNFVGRDEVLKKLEDCLLPREGIPSLQRRTFVIYGLGGSGKTQVCIKFADEHKRKFWGVFWIDASSLESSARSFASIAEIGDLDKSPDLKENARKSKEWLASIQEKWLLIIDNADDTKIDTKKFFPPGNTGSILVTTRNKECRVYATPTGMYHELVGMGLKDGITLLLKMAEEDPLDSTSRLQATPIVETLGCFALAIVQAGSAIRNGYQLDEYLEEYKRNHLQLMSIFPLQGADAYEHTVYATWELSREKIERLHSEVAFDALELLDTSSFFYFDDIPWEMFRRIPDRKNFGLLHKTMDQVWSTLAVPGILEETSYFLDVAATERSKSRIREALSLLSSYSLISWEKHNPSFSMHRLVHSWTRFRLKGQARRWAICLASTALANSVGPQRDASDYEFRRLLYGHVRFYLVDISKEMSSINDVRKADRAEKYAQVLFENGNYKMAEDLYRRSLVCRERLSSRDSHGTFKVANNLASVLEKLGHYDEAVHMSTKVLEERTKFLREDDPETLQTLSILAVALKGQGEYSRSKKATEELLKKQRRVLGNEHHATIETMNNLASLLRTQGKYKEAVDMSKECLSLRERLLGESHPDTLESLSDVAFILERQGADWAAAESMSREAFERRRKALGDESPDTLTSLNRLVSVLVKRGNYSEAEEMQRQVLEGRSKILGPDHPDTFTTFNNLADVLQRRGDLSGAQDLYRKALTGLKDRLGCEHPYTLIVETNLAIVLKQRGNTDAAEMTYRRILGIYKSKSESHCPEALACLSNLALVLQSQGKFMEAEEVGRQALDGYQRVLTEQSPETLMSLDNLAWTLQKARKYEEAESLSRRALKGFEATLGPEKPDTLETVCHLAYILHRREKYQEAWLLYRKACAGYRILGVDTSSQWCFRYFSILKDDMKAKNITEPSPIGNTSAILPLEHDQEISHAAYGLPRETNIGIYNLNQGQGGKRRRASDEESEDGQGRKKSKKTAH